MKKTFLKFPSWKQKNFLPKSTAKRNRMACYLSDGSKSDDKEDIETKDMPDDTDEIKTVKAIKRIGKQAEKFTAMLGEKADASAIKTLTDQVAELQKGIETMNSAEVAKMIKGINDSNEKLWKQVAEMQEEAAKKKESDAGNEGKPVALVSLKQIEDFVKATFVEGRKTNQAAKIELKAAENFGYPQFFQGGTGTVIDAFTGRYVDPTLYQRKRKKNLILDYFNIQTIVVPKLVYLVKIEDGDDAGSSSGDSGSADWILSSEAKPKRSFRVTTGEAEAKKVAIFGTIEDKLLKDVPSLENWVREDFMAEMREQINDGLLNNNPAVDDSAPLGLKTNAIMFTPTPAFNDKHALNTSNYIDQIIAVIALMGYNKEEAQQVFVASDVYYSILNLKDNDLRYQNNNLIYTSNLGQLYIAGVPIYWSDAEDIPSTHILCTAIDLGFKMYAYGPMVFERGLNGEDFRYDRTSYRGYQEFLSFIPSNRENSVLYDTWANIKLGIEAP